MHVWRLQTSNSCDSRLHRRISRAADPVCLCLADEMLAALPVKCVATNERSLKR